jgi:hypothetical protein
MGDSEGAIRPITAIEVAANAAERWRSQYAEWTPDNKFSDGTTKGDTDAALDRAQHTPENIAKIINTGWAYPSCDCCRRYFSVVIGFKNPWGQDTFSLCAVCFNRGRGLLVQFEAPDKIVKDNIHD